MAAVYTVIVYKKNKSEKWCLLEIVAFNCKISMKWKKLISLTTLYYFFFKTETHEDFHCHQNIVTKTCEFLLLSLHTPGLLREHFLLNRAFEESQSIPQLLFSSQVLYGRSYQEWPSEPGVPPPQDLKLWLPTHFQLWSLFLVVKWCAFPCPNPFLVCINII